MFQRFHAMREEREGGFTLIELLVVILIIAILAAIAIPVFLNQRKKGWISQAESAVKNAATAEESWLTSNNAYTTNVTDLQNSEGLRYSSDVSLTIAVNTGVAYCIKGEHSSATGDDRWYASWTGKPTSTIPTATSSVTCPAA
jgi:type IV pilus assembly protein PilA